MSSISGSTGISPVPFLSSCKVRPPISRMAPFVRLTSPPPLILSRMGRRKMMSLPELIHSPPWKAPTPPHSRPRIECGAGSDRESRWLVSDHALDFHFHSNGDWHYNRKYLALFVVFFTAKQTGGVVEVRDWFWSRHYGGGRDLTPSTWLRASL